MSRYNHPYRPTTSPEDHRRYGSTYRPSGTRPQHPSSPSSHQNRPFRAFERERYYHDTSTRAHSASPTCRRGRARLPPLRQPPPPSGPNFSRLFAGLKFHIQSHDVPYEQQIKYWKLVADMGGRGSPSPHFDDCTHIIVFPPPEHARPQSRARPGNNATTYIHELKPTPRTYWECRNSKSWDLDSLVRYFGYNRDDPTPLARRRNVKGERRVILRSEWLEECADTGVLLDERYAWGGYEVRRGQVRATDERLAITPIPPTPAATATETGGTFDRQRPVHTTENENPERSNDPRIRNRLRQLQLQLQSVPPISPSLHQAMETTTVSPIDAVKSGSLTYPCGLTTPERAPGSLDPPFSLSPETPASEAPEVADAGSAMSDEEGSEYFWEVANVDYAPIVARFQANERGTPTTLNFPDQTEFASQAAEEGCEAELMLGEVMAGSPRRTESDSPQSPHPIKSECVDRPQSPRHDPSRSPMAHNEFHHRFSSSSEASSHTANPASARPDFEAKIFSEGMVVPLAFSLIDIENLALVTIITTSGGRMFPERNANFIILPLPKGQFASETHHTELVHTAHPGRAILSQDWVLDCFNAKTLLDTTDYHIRVAPSVREGSSRYSNSSKPDRVRTISPPRSGRTDMYPPDSPVNVKLEKEHVQEPTRKYTDPLCAVIKAEHTLQPQPLTIADLFPPSPPPSAGFAMEPDNVLKADAAPAGCESPQPGEDRAMTQGSQVAPRNWRKVPIPKRKRAAIKEQEIPITPSEVTVITGTSGTSTPDRHSHEPAEDAAPKLPVNKNNVKAKKAGVQSHQGASPPRDLLDTLASAMPKVDRDDFLALYPHVAGWAAGSMQGRRADFLAGIKIRGVSADTIFRRNKQAFESLFPRLTRMKKGSTST